MPGRALNILIIEDEDDLRETMATAVAEQGHNARTARDIDLPPEELIPGDTDLILLDLMLPAGSGFDLLRQLRPKSKVPVIVVSARDGIDDRIRGLELGADDYLIKPFSYAELIARIRCVLRRSAPGSVPEQVITCGPMQLDLVGQRASLNGTEVDLTQREFDILYILAINRSRVVSREEILGAITSPDTDSTSNTLDVHIYNLRKKLGQNSVQTRRGIGYQINEEWQ